MYEMIKIPQHLILFLLLSLTSFNTSATHIRGGQIFYRTINSTTVEFTFIGYRDVDGVPFGQGRFDFGDGQIFGDDAGEAIEWTIEKELNSGIEKWKSIFVHQYAANGEYLASYTEDYRNSNSNNITGSVNTSFYVEASVLLDPFIGENTSPANKFQPNFFAISGKKLVAGFSMVDNEGDSLSYTILKPLKGKNKDVDAYRIPTDPTFYDSNVGNEAGDAPASFRIDPLSSTLIWDAPGAPGGYTVVIKTGEWRKINGTYMQIGFTVLDYEILVVGAESFYSVSLPISDCQTSLENYSDKIIVENPTEDNLSIEFCSVIEGLKFNGLTFLEWNETYQETKFSDPLTNIDVTLDSEWTQEISGLNSVFIQVTGKHTVMDKFGDPYEQDISTVSGFNIGIDCDHEKLILTPVIEEKKPVSLSISKNEVKVNMAFSSKGWLSIYDVNGRLLLDTSPILTQGSNTIAFNFDLQTPYFVILHHKKGTITEKVLLTK